MNIILKLKVKQDDKDYIVFLAGPASEVDDICNLILEYDCENEIIKMPLVHLFTDKEIKHSITDFEFKCFTELNKYIVDKRDLDDLYRFKYLNEKFEDLYPEKFYSLDEYHQPFKLTLVKLKVKQDGKMYWVYLKIVGHDEMYDVYNIIFNNKNDNEIILLPDKDIITYDVDKIKTSTSDFKFKFNTGLNKYVVEPECLKHCDFQFKCIESQIIEEHPDLFYVVTAENDE